MLAFILLNYNMMAVKTVSIFCNYNDIIILLDFVLDCKKNMEDVAYVIDNNKP